MITVTDNISKSSGSRFVDVRSFSPSPVIVSENQVQTGAGAGEPSIKVVSPYGCIVSDNRIWGASGGAYIEIRGNFHSVKGNVLWYPAEHGIDMIDCFDCKVGGNVIIGTGESASNTYDAIRLSGDSDRNFVGGNQIRPRVASGTTRYGVNVSASTCDDNVVDGNFLGDASAYGTGDFNDAGTGTITARDANGQFTY